MSQVFEGKSDRTFLGTVGCRWVLLVERVSLRALGWEHP